MKTGNILQDKSLSIARKIITEIKKGKTKGQIEKNIFSKWEKLEEDEDKIIVKTKLWFGYRTNGFIYQKKPIKYGEIFL
jgi:hypothetical protein